MDGKSHAERAEALFLNGSNCAQAVVGAYAEDFGLSPELAAKFACGLGGGVGRLREVCGAISGAAAVLGLRYGPDKAEVYPHVQELAAKFRESCGSIVCRDLLKDAGATTGGAPEPRTAEYYRRRPCVEYVKLVAQLLEDA